LKKLRLEIYKQLYITGFDYFVLDPDDPFGLNGFLIGERIFKYSIDKDRE